MVRALLGLVVIGVVVSGGTRVSGDTVFKSALHDYRVVPFVEALVQPWSIAFLPGGDVLITERPGRLRIVRNGKLLPQPVEGVPQVVFASQGGLLEVAPHPNFASNRMLYLTYSKTKADGTGPTTALVRGRFENDRLTDVQQLFESVSTGRGHFGGKIAFDKNGFLFLTLGDRQVPPEGKLEAHPAQDLSNHHGKIIRLHDDGRVPADNPFVSRAGARPEIWSYGHRNVQGLAIHPETGEVWTNEHGPQGGDELNRIRPGRNYGWPVIGFGVNYTTGLRHSLGHASRRHGTAGARLGAVDRHLGHDVLHRRQVSAVARAISLSAAWSAQQLVRLTLEGQRVARNARAANGPHPRRPPGTGRVHLPGHRRSRRQADAGISHGTDRSRDLEIIVGHPFPPTREALRRDPP